MQFKVLIIYLIIFVHNILVAIIINVVSYYSYSSYKEKAYCMVCDPTGDSCTYFVVVVNFDQSQYRFKEDKKLAQLGLTINKELNVAFNVSVKITPASATGE